MLPSVIAAGNLDLVSLSLHDLRSLESGEAVDGDHLMGWKNPDRLFIDEEAWLSRFFGRRLGEDPRHDTWLARAIVERDSNTLVGHIGGHSRPDEEARLEIGYTIGESHRGLGLATQAARGFMEALFASQEVTIVRATVSPTNHASLRVIEKLGMTEVGTQIDDVDGLEIVFEVSMDQFQRENL